MEEYEEELSEEDVDGETDGGAREKGRGSSSTSMII